MQGPENAAVATGAEPFSTPGIISAQVVEELRCQGRRGGVRNSSDAEVLGRGRVPFSKAAACQPMFTSRRVTGFEEFASFAMRIPHR